MLILILALPTSLLLSKKFRQTSTQIFGWTAGIAGGLFWMVAWPLAEVSPIGVWLFFVAVILLSVFIASLIIYVQLQRLLKASLFIAGLGIIGMGEGLLLSAWFKNDQGWLFLMLGAFAQLLGILLFGFANLKARALPRLNFIPLVMGISALLSIALDVTQITDSDLPSWIFVISLGFGWILMGIVLAVEWLRLRRAGA